MTFKSSYLRSNNINTSIGTYYDAAIGWVLSEPTVTVTTVTNTSGWHKSDNSVTTPNFRKLRKTNSLPVNPYSVARVDFCEQKGDYYTESNYPGHPRYQKNSSSNFTGGSYILPEDISLGGISLDINAKYNDLIDAVNRDLLEKSKNMKTNLLQVFAERQQAIDMVASTAKKLGTAMSLLVSKQYAKAGYVLGIVGWRNPKKRRASPNNPNPVFSFYQSGVAGANISQQTAREWLALQYGWKPLLQDIYGVCEELANRHVDWPRDLKVKTTRFFSDSRTSTQIIDNYTLYITDYIELRVIGGFIVTPGPQQSISRLGISNPALLGWELLPYSFVVDWFLPIGNWLSSLDAAWFQKADKGYLSLKTTRQRTYTQVFDGKDYPSPYYANDKVRTVGSVTWWKKTTSYSRQPILGFPEPVFPKLKNPLSMTHFLNALALIVTKNK